MKPAKSVNIEEVAAKRAKPHTRYYSKDGFLLPGTTTILGVLNKPALIPWANQLGLRAAKVRAYVDTLALIGTLGHDLISSHNKKVVFEPNGHPPELIDKAENCLLSYLEWAKHHTIEPLLCEAPLVSEQYGY